MHRPGRKDSVPHREGRHRRVESWGWQSVHEAAELPKVMERMRASISTSAPFEMTFPLRSGRGEYQKVTRWLGTSTDVEELNRAKEALRLSEQRFRVALKNSCAAVFNLDRDLRYTGYTTRSLIYP